MNHNTFTVRRVGATGHEILVDGNVVAWAMDEP